MSYETAKTVKTIISKLDRGDYLIPLLQRDYVWKQDQICKLFDSLMRNYPINTFTMWECEEEVINSGYKFYRFEPEYKYGSSMCDYPANVESDDVVMSVIDGQQRLLSLYIGLRGSYTMRGVTKHLYLNINRLLDASTSMDMKYEFKFKSESEANSDNKRAFKKNDTSVYWFKVSEVLDFKKETSIGKYIRDNEYLNSENDTTYDILLELYNAICKDPKLSYYIERNQNLDEVTDIFIRMNNCGTALKKSDLFLSMAMLQWGDMELKTKINDLVDKLNSKGNFKVTNAHVLSVAVVLTTNKQRLSTDALNTPTLNKVKENWFKAEKSLLLAYEILSMGGYTDNVISNYDMIYPIVTYLYENNVDDTFLITDDGKRNIKLMLEWFARATIKKISLNYSVYSQRKVIKENVGMDFPLNKLKQNGRGTHNDICLTSGDIDYVLGLENKKSNLKYIFALLKLINADGNTLGYIYDKKEVLKLLKDEDEVTVNKYKPLLESVVNVYIEDVAEIENRGNLSLNDWLMLKYPNVEEVSKYLMSLCINTTDLSASNYKEVLTKRESYLKYLLYANLVD